MKQYDYEKDPMHKPTLSADTFSEKESGSPSWFDLGIMPVLDDFAEMTGSVLEIQKDESRLTATLKNEDGLDITESCRPMRAMLALANNIVISAEDGIPALSLIFCQADIP